MHHRFTKVHLANQKQITGKKLVKPSLENLKPKNLFSYKTVQNLDLHFSDIISYVNR